MQTSEIYVGIYSVSKWQVRRKLFDTQQNLNGVLGRKTGVSSQCLKQGNFMVTVEIELLTNTAISIFIMKPSNLT